MLLALREAERGGAQRGKATSARWKDVEERCRKLPLLSAENQAKYLVALIQEEDEQGPTKRRPFVLSAYLGHLIRITQDSPVGLEIHVHRTIVEPPPAEPEPAQEHDG